MCHFEFTTIDLQLFIHCSLRLSSIYESLAIDCTKKTLANLKNSESTATISNDELSSQAKFTNYSVGCNNTNNNNAGSLFGKYGVPSSARENFMKAK